MAIGNRLLEAKEGDRDWDRKISWKLAEIQPPNGARQEVMGKE